MSSSAPRSRAVPMRAGLAVLLLLLLSGAAGAQPVDIYLVTNTSDAGPGSLRTALIDAQNDADGGPDRIVFSIAGAGVQTITPLSPLPALLDDNVTIDGLTQPGADCSTWPPTLRVVLDGSQLAGAGDDGLLVGGQDNTVQGLVIQGFPSEGVQFLPGVGAGDHVLRCSFIGTDASGTVAVGNGGFGVFVDNATNVTIGGVAISDTNVISGNGAAGIAVNGSATDILGNFVGTDVSGSFAIPNAEGIRISTGSDNTVGGVDGVGGNVISGNTGSGIVIVGATTSDNLVIGNWIGLDTSLQPLGNGSSGVLLGNGTTGNRIGAAMPGFGNFVVGNGFHGVWVNGATTLGNEIRRNAIRGNVQRGIHLGGGLSATPNDPGDADEGPNRLQNFPELALATLDDGADELSVQYVVPSDPGSTAFPVEVDFYVADADGEEGSLWIGSHATDGGAETATLAFPLGADALAALGNRVIATATDADGNTSEFGASLTVPEPGSAAVGTALATLAALRGRRARPARRRRSP